VERWSGVLLVVNLQLLDTMQAELTFITTDQLAMTQSAMMYLVQLI